MAEFSDTGTTIERYAAIEKAYREDRWALVIDRGGRLLSQLQQGDSGLRERLQLLMAHSYLYGFGERDAAEDLYRAVLESKAEASLRQIAAQGLEQCERPPQPLASPAVAATTMAAEPVGVPHPALRPEDLPQPVGAPSLEEDSGASLHDLVQAMIPADPETAAPSQPKTPVMPWLAGNSPPPEVAQGTPPPLAANLPWAMAEGRAMAEGKGEPTPSEPPQEPLVAEVIDEPEMIEVHQADPRLAEEIEIQETDAMERPAQHPPPQPQVPTPPEERQPSPPLVEAQSSTAEEQAPPGEEFFAEEADLLQGLLRVEIL
ncbi:MAG: hypothetical protein ACK522_04250 [Synechococcaceae cyanobacterium]